MFQVIKDFCESERKSGLLLLDAPTGSGKTYQVCKYIHEALKRDREAGVNRKYFFITTLKKNLPDTGELRRVFSEAGDDALFDEAVLAPCGFKHWQRERVFDLKGHSSRSL